VPRGSLRQELCRWTLVSTAPMPAARRTLWFGFFSLQCNLWLRAGYCCDRTRYVEASGLGASVATVQVKQDGKLVIGIDCFSLGV
jgi:hypothetical protein